MKAKEKIFFSFVLMLSLCSYSVSHLRINQTQANYSDRLHAAAFPFSTEMIKALAGEFKGLMADYLLLEAANFIGSEQSSGATSQDWDAVARLLEQSNCLDPYFRQTYRLAQATLPWHAQKYHQTLTILERSKKHLPWDWQPGFFIGFDYHYFLNDNETASNKLMEASEVKGAPLILATLASRLASKAGQTQTAIDFLNAVFEKTDDQNIKEELKRRILALQGVQLLQSAIESFKSQLGRMPNSLEELTEKEILQAIPVNPYGKPYSLKDGRVDF